MRPHPRSRCWMVSLIGAALILVLVSFPQFPKTDFVTRLSAGPAIGRFGRFRRSPVGLRQAYQLPNQGLLFDPVLVYSTFLGGDGRAYLSNDTVGPIPFFDQGVTAITVDSSGNLLVGGATTAANFPVTPGVVQPGNPQNNAVGFLSKINPAGRLVFSTYLNGMATVASIALDAAGNIYVAGISLPSDVPQAPLPIPPGTNPFDPTPRSISIVKLNSTATAILNATYLGGSGVDDVSGLTLDGSANVYLAGYTTSNDFPTLNPVQASLGAAGHNVFVTKLNSTLSSLVYSTYLGQDAWAVGAGSQSPTGTANHGIAVDSMGNAYVPGLSGGCAFLAKLNAAGSSLLYDSTNLWCGSGPGTHAPPGVFVSAVAVDGSTNAYVAGGASNDPGGPNVLAPCPPTPTLPGNQLEITGSGLISEVNASGSTTFSTCLGLFAGLSPVPNMGVNDLVLDASGNLYVVGNITSDYGIPLVNPIQTATNTFVAAINPKTPALLFSSGLGGPLSIPSKGLSLLTPTGVGVDANGNVYAAGFSTTTASATVTPPPTFPVFNALQPIPGMVAPVDAGNCGTPNTCPILDGFILQVAPTDAAAAATAPSLVTFPVEPVGTTSADQTVTIYDMGSAPLIVSNATITGDFSLDGNGCGSALAAAGGTCTIAVNFTPTATGTRNGTLTITDNSAGSPHTVQLTGEGGQGLASLSPPSLLFTPQQVGTTSAAQTVTLTNSGALAIQVTHIQASTPFDETNTCGTSVPASGTCTISVTFSPTASGDTTGTLTVTDSAANSPQTLALTGAGTGTTASPPPNVGLGIASSGSASATVTAGATATYAFTIGGAGMSGTASLACAGAPSAATCSVPATVSLNAATPSLFRVNVTTTARSQVMFYPYGPTLWLCALALLGCLVLQIMALAQLSSRLGRLSLPLLAVVLCACGGGNSSGLTSTATGTQAGAYTLVVTATLGSTKQTQNLTLVVQ
jgi:hypothetical protein